MGLKGGDGGLLTIETGEDAVRFNGPVMLQTDVRIDTDAAVATGAEVGDVLWTNEGRKGGGGALTIETGEDAVRFNGPVMLQTDVRIDTDAAVATGAEVGDVLWTN